MGDMRLISPAEVHGALDYGPLVEALRQMFRADCAVPLRHHHTVPVGGGREDATLLLMPAWQAGGHIGIKIVTVFPSNGEQSLPAVMGAYLLLDGTTGQPVAMMDGPALTIRRTAAASALAAAYLARADAENGWWLSAPARWRRIWSKPMPGVRPIREVLIWGRDPDKAAQLARQLDRPGLKVEAAGDLAAAVRNAHVVSCATLSKQPLIKGEWLSPGVHLDLIGGFTPEMREADDECIGRARVFVDTRTGACKEAGDITQPLANGRLTLDAIAGDLFDLTRGSSAGRLDEDEITLFKSVGTALEDLAAAKTGGRQSSELTTRYRRHKGTP